MSLWKKNLILLIIVVIIVVLPLVIVSGAEFAGADSEAEDMITEIAPDYEPWFESLIELPSGEIESLLFAVQAAVGAGVVCFVLGRITASPKKTSGASGGENK